MTKYTLEEAMRAQAALRNAAGEPPETFSIEQIVGMLSDEIEVLRNQGRSDAEVSEMLNAAGLAVGSESIAKFYAPPEARRGHH